MNARQEDIRRTRNPSRLDVLIATASVLVMTLSFFALRENYRGECLWIEWDPLTNYANDTRQFLFLTVFGVLFLVSFMLSAWTVTRVALTSLAPELNPWTSHSLAVIAAVVIYASVSITTWNLKPIEISVGRENWKLLYLSVFWPIGLLQETGNYSPTLCAE